MLYFFLTISVNFITVIKRDLVLLPSLIRTNSPELKNGLNLTKLSILILLTLCMTKIKQCINLASK